MADWKLFYGSREFDLTEESALKVRRYRLTAEAPARWHDIELTDGRTVSLFFSLGVPIGLEEKPDNAVSVM